MSGACCDAVNTMFGDVGSTQSVCPMSILSYNARAAAFQVQSLTTELDLRSCRKSWSCKWQSLA